MAPTIWSKGLKDNGTCDLEVSHVEPFNSTIFLAVKPSTQGLAPITDLIFAYKGGFSNLQKDTEKARGNGMFERAASFGSCRFCIPKRRAIQGDSHRSFMIIEAGEIEIMRSGGRFGPFLKMMQSQS